MSQTKSTLTIGLPIYNEERNLEDFFCRLAQSLSLLDDNIQVETIACINGCTDDSLQIATKVASSELGKRINLRIIESEKGKVNAISEIVKSRQYDGPVCFIDTDTMPIKDTIPRLLENIRNSPECYVCYAKCIPYYYVSKDDLTEFQAEQKAYYNHRGNLPPRKYFHGRAYIMRDDTEIKQMTRENDRIKSENKHDDDLSDGIRVDDIYLSPVILHKYGQHSIREVIDAPIFFHPPENEEDLFSGIVRTLSEIRRIKKFCPNLAIENKIDRELEAMGSLEDQQISISGYPKVDEKVVRFMTREEQLWKKAMVQISNDSDQPSDLAKQLRTTHWVTLMTTKRPFVQDFLDR